MPGHVKLGKAGEPDPDPLPYLVISMEQKREDQLMEYDPKKTYWCPDGKGGFMKSMLQEDDGKKALVLCGGFEVISHFIILYRFNIMFYPLEDMIAKDLKWK